MNQQQLFLCFQISLGIITSLIASPLVFYWFFDVGDLSSIVFLNLLTALLPILIGVSILGLIRERKGALVGVHVFLALTTFLCFITIGNKILKDSPSVQLEATFYHESGFDLFFREDMTVKCIEKDIFSTTDKYGKYELREDTIILTDIDIIYGLSEVTDTMVIRGDKLMFRLDQEWRRILEGEMYIEKNTLK